MKGNVSRCRKCGREIGIITQGIYRKMLVDAEAVPVIADSLGEDFVRIDGSKVRAREAKIGTENELDLRKVEYAYRQHSRTCGVER